MKISELADKSGMSVSTLRYYEKRGLLDPAARTVSGYREYSESALGQLTIIASAKKLGFTLEKIRLILKAAGAPAPCEIISELARERLISVRGEIMELQSVAKHLEECQDKTMCATLIEKGACPVLSCQPLTGEPIPD